VKFQRTGATELSLTWDDGHVSRYTLEQLRDLCPCAGCQGETVIMHAYVPPPPDRTVPGRYTLLGIQPVGSYAVQLQWGDGHETGIYSWEHLLKHCPCERHGATS
jgi:DUF971 family protein